MTPLAFDPAGYFVFLPIKLTVAVPLVLLGIAGLMLVDRPISRSPVLLAWAALLAVFVAASVLGIGGLTSWIGYPGRSLGVIAWVIFGCAFWLGASSDERERERVVRAASMASILVAAYALLQAAGFDPIEWSENIDVSRTRSTLGNAAFLGAYLALMVPLAARLSLASSEPTRVRAIHGLATVLGIAALLTTQTRGAWLGAIAGGVLVLALEWRRLRAAPVHLVAAGLGMTAVILVLLATTSPYASRIRSIADPNVGTGRGRLIQWSATLQLIEEKPVLGWGPETYAFAFPRFITPEFEREVGREVVPDRAHNVILDLASVVGLAGVAAYVAIVGLIAWAVVRVRERDPLIVGLAGGCAAYLIQLQFSFPLADLDIVFWLFAGLLIAAAGSRKIVIVRRWAAVPVGAALVLGAWWGTDVVADRMLRAALEAEATQEFDEALRVAEGAVAAAPGRVQYLQADARLHLRVAESLGTTDDFSRGLELLDRALALMPRDLELAMDRADLLLSWGEVARDRSLIADAAFQYEEILDFDPASSRAHLKVGVAYVQLGRSSGAEVAWLRASSLAPDSPGPLVNLGLLYEQDGRVADARAAFERVLRLDPDNVVARDALKRLGT